MQRMTFVEQADLMSRTTVLVTPCGGVSMMLPYLPEGAHAIVMDYYVTSEDMFGWAKGDSASMEVSFWNLWPHIKMDYYQIYDPSVDHVFD